MKAKKKLSKRARPLSTNNIQTNSSVRNSIALSNRSDLPKIAVRLLNVFKNVLVHLDRKALSKMLNLLAKVVKAAVEIVSAEDVDVAAEAAVVADKAIKVRVGLGLLAHNK